MVYSVVQITRTGRFVPVSEHLTLEDAVEKQRRVGMAQTVVLDGHKRVVRYEHK